MENLDTRVKDLTDENEQLKKENSRLSTRIHILEMEVCISLIKFKYQSDLFLFYRMNF
jgi:cell division protein FtsB